MFNYKGGEESKKNILFLLSITFFFVGNNILLLINYILIDFININKIKYRDGGNDMSPYLACDH